MRRSIALGLVLVLLAGCATFSTSDTASHSDIPDRDTTPVSLQQMRLLVPGEWYAVRLPEKDGRSHSVGGIFHTGYVGQLQKSDDNSLTLTEVTKCTLFESRSALRHLPIVGSNYEHGWMGCKNQPGTVNVPRSNVMWFEPISAKEADKYRRYNEIAKEPFSLEALEANTDPDDPMAQFGVIDERFPESNFLHPNPEMEANQVKRWMEIREVQAGEWYNVLAAPERRSSPHRTKLHVGIVDHVSEDGVYFSNVTTGFPGYGGSVGSEKTGEIMLRFSEIDKVAPLTPEEAEEQIASFNRRRELPMPRR